jgi:hypothetical protein
MLGRRNMSQIGVLQRYVDMKTNEIIYVTSTDKKLIKKIIDNPDRYSLFIEE